MNSTRILDIGCGTGDFMLVARACGLECSGIEPSQYASQIAANRGLNIVCAVLDDYSFDEQFDGIHCSHVLEHVPNGRLLLRRVRSLLRAEGLLYLEVPLQFDGILDRLKELTRRTPPFSLHSIHHHYFFSPEAIQRLLEQEGFTLVSFTTHVAARRAARKPGLRKWGLQGVLWTADRLASAGDVISVWARRH